MTVHVGGFNPASESSLVTITLMANGNPGLLGGTFTVRTNTSGDALFNDLSVSAPGVSYFRATVPGATPAQSNAFTIGSAPIPVGATLIFVTQPSAAHGGQPIAPTVHVLAQDFTAAPLPGVTVTLSLLANPGGATLIGFSAVTDGVGIASFPGLALDRGGYGYTLVAQSGASSSLPSTPFNIMGFTPTGAMQVSRSGHRLTKLLDGTVLVTGGAPGNNNAEVYDPSSGAFTLTAGQMGSARTGHTATRLADGRVLIAGGLVGSLTVKTTEIYDPGSRTFSPGPDLQVTREDHTATLLADGRVLIAGGFRNGAVLSNTAEI